MSKPKLVALGGSSTLKGQDLDAFIKNLEIDVLARTLWGEARGEGTAGMQAVASVILNRVKIAKQKGLRAIRTPRPPPPAAALIITG